MDMQLFRDVFDKKFARRLNKDGRVGKKPGPKKRGPAKKRKL